MRRAAIVLAVILPWLPPLPVRAQGTDPARVPYYLTTESTFQRGCFDPCDCLLEPQRRILGAFLLRPAGLDPLFTYYDVTDVDWVVGPASDPLRVTGSGSFRIGGEVAIQQQLSLDLQVGSDPPEHFDSGLVVGGGAFPEIHLSISIHGMVCYDTVIQVHARPAIALTVDATSLAWNPLPQAAGFDVVTGDLGRLRATGGDFAVAARACLADDWPGHALVDPSEPPAPGAASWYLVRHETPFFPGSYDDEPPSLAAPRDPGLNASPAACP